MYEFEKWGGGKFISGLQGGVNSSSRPGGGGSAVEIRWRGSLHFFSTSVVAFEFSGSVESNSFVFMEESISLILLGRWISDVSGASSLVGL